jgi:hypothetical protein
MARIITVRLREHGQQRSLFGNEGPAVSKTKSIGYPFRRNLSEDSPAERRQRDALIDKITDAHRAGDHDGAGKLIQELHEMDGYKAPEDETYSRSGEEGPRGTEESLDRRLRSQAQTLLEGRRPRPIPGVKGAKEWAEILLK